MDQLKYINTTNPRLINLLKTSSRVNFVKTSEQALQIPYDYAKSVVVCPEPIEGALDLDQQTLPDDARQVAWNLIKWCPEIWYLDYGNY